MVLHRVGETATQSIAVKSVDCRIPIVPSIGDPGGASEALIVIEKNPVLFDVSNLVRIEKKLRRADVRSARPFVSDVQIGGERPVIVAAGQLPTVNLAALVVE